MIRLVFAYMFERRLTTVLNILLLAISVAMLALLLQFARQSEERFLSGAEGIDLVVGAKGSPLQLVLSSVYHLDQPTGNIPHEALDDLRSNPLVRSAIPLALGDQFAGFRIVGTEPAFVDHYGANLVSGEMYHAPLEVVLGAEVARETGAGLGQRFVGSHGLAEDEEGPGHTATPFVVTGILSPTGKPIDRLIVTSLESVWDVHGIEHDDHDAEDHEHEGEEQADHLGRAEVTAILVRYRNASAAIRLPPMINRNTAMQAASPARESTRLILMFEPAIRALGMFALLLAGAGALAIFVALWNAIRARERDLALLRVMGARRASIFGTVLLEGMFTALLAGLVGIGLAHLLLWVAGLEFHSLADAGIDPWRFIAEEGYIVLGAVLLGMVASVLPALVVMRSNLAPILNRP